MSPSAIDQSSLSLSALQEAILASKPSNSTISEPTHPPHLQHLALQIKQNLQYQHDWTSVQVHTYSSPSFPSPISTESQTQPSLLPRPLISGIPPKRLYIHPDEQIELLKAGRTIVSDGKDSGVGQERGEREWVLPTHIQEKWSLRKFAEVFDAVEVVPPAEEPQDDEKEDIDVMNAVEEDDREPGWQWRGNNRQKRILLATLHDDSTVVYYIIHDGEVKPRQN